MENELEELIYRILKMNEEAAMMTGTSIHLYFLTQHERACLGKMYLQNKVIYLQVVILLKDNITLHLFSLYIFIAYIFHDFYVLNKKQ